ncbi:MAG: hypothetical protein U1C33_02925 [Candidatus Cloacimonadaceae bacterium]|nr:hypothetical protein [Candidatus Cloacimonadaceae bacterium]
MSNELIYEIARQIAEQINQKVNIPFLNEDEEQALFQLLVLKALEILWSLRNEKPKGGLK